MRATYSTIFTNNNNNEKNNNNNMPSMNFVVEYKLVITVQTKDSF
jgi:hypothetical protein